MIFVYKQYTEIYRKYRMKNITSILKQTDPNIMTKQLTTNNTQQKWLTTNTNSTDTNGNSMSKTKSQFKQIQIKILNMFTIAKSELSASYQQIVSMVKRIQKCMVCQNFKASDPFWNLLHEIQLQIQDKSQNIACNLQKVVVDKFLFDQLLAFIPDACNNQSVNGNFHSHKKINNSSSNFSTGRIGQKMINQTIADIDNISANQYKSALKIKPNDKRIENLGCLSGKWQTLQVLNLQNKKLFRMIPFSTVIADALQEINLSHNQITRLDFLKQAQYSMLRTLNLEKNLINSLDGIQSTKLLNLKFLNLSDNKLKKLDHLPQTHFPQLIQINLSNNRLQKIESLIQCNFAKLQVLNIDKNSITNIDFILSCTFYRLKILSFCYNQIKSIDCLKKCRLMRLQALLGYNNKIQSIKFLQQCDFPQLKQIILNNNLIKDISVIQKLKFPNLTQFDLQNNKMEPQQVLCFTTKSSQYNRAKKKYPFIQL